MLVIVYLFSIIFGNTYTVISSIEHIDKHQEELYEIKSFLEANNFYKNYQENDFFNLTNKKSISFNLEDGNKLNLHLFSVGEKDLIPFIKNNFDKFVHKNFLLELTKTIYEYLISEVQFFPLNPNLDYNYALCSYEKTDGAVIMLTLFRIKLY